ncbi:hypothetical protein BaRGS_00018429 [Batillaria attramentaria]|uniref:Uncharacterized protein n=1 Tax=Batillaria attramentaria TaxID=370345 RepID=A0ABD0KSM7_9CAEN
MFEPKSYSSVLHRVSGLTVTPFKGIPHLQTLHCSADTLTFDFELYSLAVYELSSGKEIASLKPWKNECITSNRFSSCWIDKRDPRKTRLMTIVTVLDYHVPSEFGCNVTYSKIGGQVQKITWYIAVKRRE